MQWPNQEKLTPSVGVIVLGGNFGHIENTVVGHLNRHAMQTIYA
jgi:hypothetical protein